MNDRRMTLADLALTEYESSSSTAQAEEQRSQDDQRNLRERWRSHAESLGPRLTEKLAHSLGIAPDHAALADLTWRTNPESLLDLQFVENRQGLHIAVGNTRLGDLYARVANGVFIEAAPWGIGTVSARFYLAESMSDISSRSLYSLADLGRAISEAKPEGGRA